MQKLKQTGIALIVAGLLSANAWASEAAVEPVTAQPVAAFTDADLNALFEQEADKPMQLAALSGQEMRETEGAIVWKPYLIGAGVRGAWGGAASGIRYAVSHAGTPQWSIRDQGRAIGYGFAGGVAGWNRWSAATIGTVVGAAGMRWGW